MCGGQRKSVSSMNKGRFLVIGFVFIFVFSSVTFAYADENLTVEVSITSYAEITLDPSSIGWYEVIPGTTGGVKYVDVENTGSANLTNMYAYVDTNEDETSTPYTTGWAQSYAAGGVIAFANMTLGVNATAGTEKYFFAGRLEWNWTEVVGNTDHSTLNQSPTAWGFFRNVSNDYYWIVRNGTNASADDGAVYCNNSGAVFAIEDDKDLGTVDTRTPDAVGITYEGTYNDDSPWGIFSVNRVTSPLYDMCVAVNYTCDKIYIYKYDKRNEFGLCSNSDYIKASKLAPGGVERLSLDVWIPKGIPLGNLSTARFVVTAT